MSFPGSVISACKEDFTEEGVGRKDFVLIFPPELSHYLFKYLPDKDIYNCSQCSTAWRRAINTNAQWKLRCTRKGWHKVHHILNPHNLATLPSYSEENEFRFRSSPTFIPPPVPTLRMEELCDWAMYFRERFHLEKNWKCGRYIIHKLIPPDEPLIPIVYNACASNSNYFVAGTTLGYLFIWKSKGKPRLVQSFIPANFKTEIERIQINDQRMLVLCSDGILLCYPSSEETLESKQEVEPKYVLQLFGKQIPDVESELRVQLFYNKEEAMDFTPGNYLANFEKSDFGKNLKRTNLFCHLFSGNDKSLGESHDFSPINATDILFTLKDEYVYLSLMLENHVMVLEANTGILHTKLTLPRGMTIASKTQIAGGRKLVLSAQSRDVDDQLFLFEKTYHVLLYDLQDVLEKSDARSKEFSSSFSLADVQLDPQEERVVWVSQDSTVVGKSLKDQRHLFSRQEESFVDHLTPGEEIIAYHLYDGQVLVINWSGVVQYMIKMRIGIVRGIILTPGYIITAGDTRTLAVHERKTGELCHRVYHHPCKISWLLADITKIITMGREQEDTPVLVGYW